jgi:hypothetical protein
MAEPVKSDTDIVAAISRERNDKKNTKSDTRKETAITRERNNTPSMQKERCHLIFNKKSTSMQIARIHMQRNTRRHLSYF